MSFQGPQNIKIGGNLGGRARSADAIQALVIAAPTAVVDGFQFGTAYRLMSVQEAEELGLNAAYDANEDSRIYYHITEFFRNNPGGILWILGVEREDDATPGWQELINAAKGLMLNESVKREPRVIGIAFDRTVATPTYTGGFETGVTAAVPLAQTMVNDLFAQAIYVDGVVLEGRGLQYPLTDLANLRQLNAPNVSICAAQDPKVVSLDPDNANMNQHAAIGAALGMISQRKVSEDMGSVDIAVKPDSRKGQENYTLTDELAERWLSANLSGGTPFNTLTLSDQSKLNEYGVIFAGKFEGYPGIYFSGSHTCTLVTNDFSYIERNRVWNKAARLVRAALIPKIRSEVPVTEEGKIAATTVASWETAVERNVGQMLTASEISGMSFSIVQEDEEGNAINFLAGEAIITRLGVTPNGIAKEIKNEIGFVNPNA